MSDVAFYLFWLCIGGVAAAVLGLFAATRPSGEEQNIYALSLLVAALIYAGFGYHTGDLTAASIESIGVVLYGIFAYLGWKRSLIWSAAGWLLHPLWDGWHLLGANIETAPTWYAIGCLSFDVVIAAVIFRRHQFQRTE